MFLAICIYVEVQGEVVSSYVEAASYPEDLPKVVNEGGRAKQIFSADETVLSEEDASTAAIDSNSSDGSVQS